MQNNIKKCDDSNFAEMTSKGLVLVDFYADWCGPCKMLAPIIDDVASQVEGKASIVKVDVDQAQQTAAKFSVTSIPTLILLKDGSEVARVVGLQDADAIKSLIEKNS